MIKLTHKELLRQLMYNPWNGLFYWKVSNYWSVKVGSIAGSSDKDGYIIIGINGKSYKAHRLAWFYVYNCWPGKNCHHRDEITYHNWISNLGDVSRSVNNRISGNNKNNTSGVKGVKWDKQSNRWETEIHIDSKCVYLGRHKDFDEAVCHRLACEQCIGDENSESTSPAYLYVQGML